MDTKGILKRAGITPDRLRDQFFLIDDQVLNQIINPSEIDSHDTVLEIGAGIGNLTRKLAQRAGSVIAFEIDTRFKLLLSDLPENVDMRFEDAHGFISQGGKFRHKKEYNKVVSNIPYSIGEWLLHNLAFIDYNKVILLVAEKFAKSIKMNPIFTSFYKVEEKIPVPKEKFYPVPSADSVVIDLVKLSDPIETKNLTLFLRQFIYQNEGWKVKNSLREGLIKYEFLVNRKRLTKNEAREIIESKEFDERQLEEIPGSEIYDEITKKFS